MLNTDQLNEMSTGKLPGFLGIRILKSNEEGIVSEMPVKQMHMAPNGYLHAGAVVSLADTSCGYACRTHLPEQANGFTTIELKSNHLSTALDGTLECTATPVHIGRTTHVWDAVVTHRETAKTIAMFRCTQMVLYPRS